VSLSEFFKKWSGRAFSSIRSFSPREKIIFLLLASICFASALGILLKANSLFMVEIPKRGGHITEGVIGAPRFINPLLAISDADRDLTQLIYSGLMRARADGELVPDLAETWGVSDDGLIYTFTLKDGLTWHDGNPITSDDVLFTIAHAKESSLKSPKRASWEGVTTTKRDEHTIEFTLEQPYSPFLENATLGILPKHIWESVSSEQFGFSTFNVEPIGSGPYKMKTIRRDSSGIPTYYELTPFKDFALQGVYINKITIRFYANEEELLRALNRGEIESVNAIAPERARIFGEKGYRVTKYTLPRIFGVFFNQSQNTIFTNEAVREALNVAVDGENIVNEVLHGYGTALYGPLPPGSLGFTKHKEEELVGSPKERAEEILETAGWKKDEESGIRQKKTKKGTQELTFSLSTSDAQDLRRTADILKILWEELGASVEVKVFKSGDLNQNVIRPRTYDALFFGEIIGRESDPFAFWHSSQRNDPGLNIALYTNITTDKLLEEGREISDAEERTKIYQQFQDEVIKDMPFVPIYSPDFIYIIPNTIKGIEVGTITVPSERFLDVHNWHIETARVWKIFQ